MLLLLSFKAYSASDIFCPIYSRSVPGCVYMQMKFWRTASNMKCLEDCANISLKIKNQPQNLKALCLAANIKSYACGFQLGCM